jgi:hypothetical protein
MVIRPAPERPVILAFRILEGKIIDACEPDPHKAVAIKLPVLVAV